MCSSCWGLYLPWFSMVFHFPFYPIHYPQMNPLTTSHSPSFLFPLFLPFFLSESRQNNNTALCLHNPSFLWTDILFLSPCCPLIISPVLTFAYLLAAKNSSLTVRRKQRSGGSAILWHKCVYLYFCPSFIPLFALPFHFQMGYGTVLFPGTIKVQSTQTQLPVKKKKKKVVFLRKVPSK